jgi:hypothetical protein
MRQKRPYNSKEFRMQAQQRYLKNKNYRDSKQTNSTQEHQATTTTTITTTTTTTTTVVQPHMHKTISINSDIKKIDSCDSIEE